MGAPMEAIVHERHGLASHQALAFEMDKITGEVDDAWRQETLLENPCPSVEVILRVLKSVTYTVRRTRRNDFKVKLGLHPESTIHVAEWSTLVDKALSAVV